MRNIFLDIETAPTYESIEEYPIPLREKMEQKYPDGNAYEMAGVHAEFAKIVCISLGRYDGGELVVKSLTGDEFDLLLDLQSMKLEGWKIIGHNILGFDIPFIQRRMAVNNLPLPGFLKTSGKKPWDLDNQFADTMVMWSSTQWKYNVSLAVLCELFEVPTPKGAMDGSKVGKAFYEGRIDEIVTYCEKDVEATAKVFSKLKFIGL